jgi:hypothetical protein
MGQQIGAGYLPYIRKMNVNLDQFSSKNKVDE